MKKQTADLEEELITLRWASKKTLQKIESQHLLLWVPNCDTAVAELNWAELLGWMTKLILAGPSKMKEDHLKKIKTKIKFNCKPF